MAAWDTADLAIMFDDDMPGYRLALISGAAVPGVFRAPAAAAFDGLVGGNAPSFRCATESLPTLTRGLAIPLNGTSYTVGDWDHLPEGVTVITLDAP